MRAGLANRYDLLRLSDIADLGDAGNGEEIVYANMLDDAQLDAAMEGMDCVVHLAGVPQEEPWETILLLTIDGCFRVFEAARRAGVRRIVYASSNHAIGFYPREQTVGTDVPLRPDGRYGVSKAFGEALGRMYADKHGMSVACVRIGSFRAKPEDRRQLMTWISHRDTVQLFQRVIEHPAYEYCVVYGVSTNTRAIWDNSAVDWLGYTPQDNAEDFLEELSAHPDSEDGVARRFHGGSFCSDEFTAGDLS
ncbi:MAG: NAD(P)-dependent oxidoreductase [Pseudomonadota bacterium]